MKKFYATAMALGALAFVPASAAASTVGQTGEPSGAWSGGYQLVMSNYVITSSGSVTSFQTQSGDCGNWGAGQYDFQVLRPVGGGQYLVVGDTGNHTDPCNGQLISYPVNIAARANDVLGVYVATTWVGTIAGPGVRYQYIAEPSPGQTFTAGSFPCCGSIDVAATIEAPQDAIAPTTTDNAPSGWQNHAVSVTLSANDNDGGSGVASTHYSVDGGSDQVGTSVSVSGEGTHTVSYYSVDNAGNQESPHSATVKIDTVAPVISYTGNSGSYSVADAVNITCSATDPAPGSGLVTSTNTCQNITGDAYTLGIGAHSYTAQATDNAGNTGSSSTSFTVTVSSDSLGTLTKLWVTSTGIASALCAKLDAAQASLARGDTSGKNGQLDAFRNQLSAQSGKSIPADKAAILAQLARTL